jgi:glucose/mannose-6-phosphate isomerase
MGGSGVVGDIVLDLSTEVPPRVPIALSKGLRLPRVNKPLIIAISYSGNTIETLRVTREALRRGYPTVGITTGGELGQMLGKLGIPLLNVPRASAPRFALPAMLYPTLLILDEFDVMRTRDELERGIRGIEKALASTLQEDVAMHLVDGLPVIWATESRRGVGTRFKNDLNENSKKLAVLSIVPEGAHNDIAAVVGREPRHVLIGARTDEEYDYLSVVEELLRRRGSVVKVDLEGERPLEREMFGVTLLGLSTLILAHRLNVDPVRTEMIDELKELLRRSPY